jgi:hypothetical protein
MENILHSTKELALSEYDAQQSEFSSVSLDRYMDEAFEDPVMVSRLTIQSGIHSNPVSE